MYQRDDKWHSGKIFDKVYYENLCDVPTEPVSIEDITFYDSQGREITEEFDLSGGAIQ